MNIINLFDEAELKQKNNGDYQTVCPDCGLQGGRTEGFILFPETNTAFCHSSQKWFTMLECAALKLKIIKCLEGRDKGEDESCLDDGLNVEVLDTVKDEYGVDFYKEFKEMCGFANIKFANQLDAEEEETEIEVTISKEKINFDLFTKNALTTNHLILYDEMNIDLGLSGDNYEPFKKGLWYNHHSLMQPTISYKISLKTKIDNRYHMLGISSPSGGKTTIKNQIKRFCPGEDLIEVSGLSHPEQLVGKMKTTGRGENKITKPIYGILHYKSVIYDEAQDLINEKNDIYAKSQRLKRIAMDNYEDNIISKKLVDDSPDKLLQYPSPSRVFDFIHPVKLESPFFDTGSFRRYNIFNLIHDSVINLSGVTDFKMDEKFKNRNYSDLINDLYSEKRVNVKFKQSTLDVVSHYHKCLLYYLLNHKNQNAFRYGLLNRYSLRNVFCKNILILALSKNEKTPTLQTTINACVDTLLFIFKTIECIDEFGDMSISSDVWGGLNEMDAQALEFLWRKKATSKNNTEISIKKFWTILGHLYGCRVTQSRSHFYRLKRDGFIDSKRAGSEESKVWLKFIPKEIKLDSEGYEPFDFLEKHLVTASSKNTLLAVVKRVFTHKNYEKAVTDGTAGVMGCLLFNNTYMCEPSNKNKNNIYICKDGVQTPTVMAVTPKNQKSHIKTPKVTAKTTKNRPTVTKKIKKQTSDREVQFWEAEECKDIKPNHTKEDVLKWVQDNPKSSWKTLYSKFGVGCLKFRNELIREGLIDDKRHSNIRHRD